MYFEISIVTSNIFINLILFKVIFLTNYTCLRKHLILFISLNGSYLRCMLNTVIIFQSFRTIFKISTSDVSFFTRLLCIFAIFNMIVLNFEERTSFSNICTNILILRQNLRLLLLKPTTVCLFVFWLLWISITGFVIKIVFTLFTLFIIYFILKLYIFINVFIRKLAIFLGISCIYSLGFYRYSCFTVLCFLPLYCQYIFLLTYCMFLGILSIHFIFYLHVQ